MVSNVQYSEQISYCGVVAEGHVEMLSTQLEYMIDSSDKWQFLPFPAVIE
jgi:hypothetical protein